MNFLIKTTALSLVAGALTLATPGKSEAQFGLNLQFGNSGFSYYNGPSYYPSYRPYSNYQPYYGNYGYRSGYGHNNYYNQRPVIVHPEVRHGNHSHGHIHVPSRYGYRTVPY